MALTEVSAELGFRFGATETRTNLGYVALEKQESDRAEDLLAQAVYCLPAPVSGTGSGGGGFRDSAR